MWVKANQLTVGQKIDGIHDKTKYYMCDGLSIVAVNSTGVIMRHSHGDLEHITDPAAEFYIKEK